MYIFLILAALFSSGASFAKTIKIANGEYTPYCSEKLAHYGIWSHIVSEAFALKGIKVEYQFFPWKRAIDNVEFGANDATIGFSKTPERLEKFRFSDSPLGDASVVFFQRVDSKFDWKTVDDLKGKSIGVMQGYATGEEMEKLKKEGKNLDLKYATTEVQNFQKLLMNRIDVFPVVEVVGWKILEENFSAKEISQIKIHPLPWKEKQLYVVFSKKNPEAETLNRAFEDGLKELKKSGRHAKMLKDFKNGAYEKKPGSPK